MKEAMFYNKLADKRVKCDLCSHRCSIPLLKKGVCGVRENLDGMLYSLVYGKIIAHADDPIEKKPLFHFFPGSRAYSIATVGCNFRCRNCQNSDISQISKDRNLILGHDASPEEVVRAAKRYNCESIAYTYTEPTIFFEYAYDIAKLASKEGIKNIFVTNGYITEDALNEIEPYLDAANIDLKGISEDFYRKVCGASLHPVLESIKLHKSLKIWIELTTLIIPTLNDSEESIRGIAEFIKEVGDEIPWHISRFHPSYRLMNLPSTPIETIRRARSIGLETGLRYVYEGNVPGEAGENTHCYKCGKSVVSRYGFQILENNIEASSCSFCGTRIDGVYI